MVMTILEARVDAHRATEVEPVFRKGTAELPPEIVSTWLIRDSKDPELYRLCTVWRDRASLMAMRASGEKPKGVQMFEQVGATASLTIADVVVTRSH
jgi:quinol monooxygenase YgiN